MSTEGVPQEAIPEESNEAFVPADKLDQFNELAAIGEGQEQLGEQLATDIEVLEKDAEKNINKGLTLSAGGVAVGVFAGPIGAVPGAALMVAGLYKGVKSAIQSGAANDISDQRREVEMKKNSVYDQSRGIVEEQLREEGAHDVVGELRATPEQIEIARKEMEEKVGE